MASAAEAKLADAPEDGVNLVRYEYLSESDDDGFEYEEVPESDEDDEDDDLLLLGGEETLAAIERSVLKTGSAAPAGGAASTPGGSLRAKREATVSDEGEEREYAESKGEGLRRAAAANAREAKTVVRPAVVDDFFRAFLIKLGMQRTLDCFNTEWYELEAKGKLNDEQIAPVPDVYLRNEELDEMVKGLRTELDKWRGIAEKAQSTWDKFRKERDFHRLHHKRVVQEKNKLIGEIKRIKKHYSAFEPMIKQLRQKYEHAMKEKMLMNIDRNKFATRNEALENKIRVLEELQGDSLAPKVALESGSSEGERVRGGAKATKSRGSRAGAKRLTGQQASSKPAAPRTPGIPEIDPINPYLNETFERPTVQNMETLKTFEGHVNAISAIAYHPRKQVVATASDDHTWKLWSVPNGDLIMSGEGHQDWVASVDFDPRGTHLLSSAGDGTVKLWDFGKAQCTATLTDHAQPVWGVAWHYSSKFFASCSMDHTARLWDVERLKVRQTFRGHVDSVNAVRFQPYSSNVCTASGDKTVSMWDSRSGLCVQTFFGHNNACNSLSINLKGDVIASCDADGVVKLWDVRMVKELFTLDGGTHALNDVCFDRSGTVVAAASDDGTIKMFDAVEGQPLSQLRGHEDAVQAVAFDPNANFFVSAASDRTFRVWKL